MKLRQLLALACVLIALPCFAHSNEQEEQNQKDKIASLVDSMAARIYKLAWPTATYNSWRFDDFRRAQGGYRLIIKLSGLSAWDDSDLWLKLGFLVNGDGLQDVRVVEHNALLMTPFATSEAIGKLTVQLAKQYAASNPVRPVAPSRALLKRTNETPTQGGAICIVNSTKGNLSFSYRWGGGAWTQQTLEAGKGDVIWWPYAADSDRSSPPFEIEYDDSFAEGYTGQKYVLDRYAAPIPATCDGAKQYRFTAQGVNISLDGVN